MDSHSCSIFIQKTNRRNPSVNVRQVNLRKLFSDEESQAAIPPTNHRPLKNKNSAMEESYKSAYISEQTAVNKLNHSIILDSSKPSKQTNRPSTRKETVELKETIGIEEGSKNFDESYLVSNHLQDILKDDRGKTKDENEFDVQRPKQPKQEKPLPQQKQEVKQLQLN